MTIKELQSRLIEMNIPEDMYSIMVGGYPNEAFCLVKTDNGWEVYYSERGHKSSAREFASESEACDYLERKLKKYAC